MDGEGGEESWRRELCDRLSFSLGSPKSGVGHGIAFPVNVQMFTSFIHY